MIESAKNDDRAISRLRTNAAYDISSAKISPDDIPSHDELWNNCKIGLQEKIPGPFFETFIQNLIPAPSHSDEKKFTLYSDESILPFLKDKYEDAIKNSLIQNGFMGQVSLLAKKNIPSKEAAPCSTTHDTNRGYPQYQGNKHVLFYDRDRF